MPKKRLLLVLLFLLQGCNGEDGADVRTNQNAPPRAPFEQPNVIIFFTDDQGWPDVAAYNQLDDVITPNIDKLAQSGTLFQNGYVTAPQCSPSRAAMHTGIYQQKFGTDENIRVPMPLSVTTIADRFKALGYTTGMVGKWHLDINRLSKEWASENYPNLDLTNFAADQIPFDVRQQFFPNARGYDDVYTGTITTFWRNFTLSAQPVETEYTQNADYRIDVVSDAADAFIRKNADTPFYLHISHFGPHVPMEAPDKYLDQIAQDMPVRRRYALATMLAIDEGVGKIMSTLEELNLSENTLIIFLSDNGAPLGEDKTDAPISDRREEWNGSENVPLRGEKGMLTEGGLKVPFIINMPGLTQPGSTIDAPVISIDALATGLALAGGNITELDGIDLQEALKGDTDYLEERSLFWRFQGQRAIRKGRWKYLEADDRRYLFDMLGQHDPEGQNLLTTFPDIAQGLLDEYDVWSAGLTLPDDPSRVSNGMKARYDYHMDPNRIPMP